MFDTNCPVCVARRSSLSKGRVETRPAFHGEKGSRSDGRTHPLVRGAVHEPVGARGPTRNQTMRILGRCATNLQRGEERSFRESALNWMSLPAYIRSSVRT